MTGKAPSPALERFLQSMNIGFIEWHDGIGYDLGALAELSRDELEQVETLLVSRGGQDWRDVEALAALSTPRAVKALKDCLLSPNIVVRLSAARTLKEMDVVDRVEETVLGALPHARFGQGLTHALALAQEVPTESIKRKLLWCCVHGNDDIRIHCAALSLFLHGKASSEFDRDQEIVFKFGDRDERNRMAAFRELCQIIGVDPHTALSAESALGPTLSCGGEACRIANA